MREQKNFENAPVTWLCFSSVTSLGLGLNSDLGLDSGASLRGAFHGSMMLLLLLLLPEAGVVGGVDRRQRARCA